MRNLRCMAHLKSFLPTVSCYIPIGSIMSNDVEHAIHTNAQMVPFVLPQSLIPLPIPTQHVLINWYSTYFLHYLRSSITVSMEVMLMMRMHILQLILKSQCLFQLMINTMIGMNLNILLNLIAPKFFLYRKLNRDIQRVVKFGLTTLIKFYLHQN